MRDEADDTQKRRTSIEKPQNNFDEKTRFVEASSLFSSTDSSTFPIPSTVHYSTSTKDQKAFKTQDLADDIDWEHLNQVTQSNIRMAKSATFPRQSQKCEQDEQALYYPGQNVVLVRESAEVAGGAFAYNPYIGQTYRAYRVAGKLMLEVHL